MSNSHVIYRNIITNEMISNTSVTDPKTTFFSYFNAV